MDFAAFAFAASYSVMQCYISLYVCTLTVSLNWQSCNLDVGQT